MVVSALTTVRGATFCIHLTFQIVFAIHYGRTPNTTTIPYECNDKKNSLE